jgi:NAD(P) transhydrogenase subunit alpha
MCIQRTVWVALALLLAVWMVGVPWDCVVSTSLLAATGEAQQPGISLSGSGELQNGSGGQGAVERQSLDYWSMLFVFMLATFIGIGVIRRVSRLLHTPLMSLTNAISAIAVVGSIIVTGSDHPTYIRILGTIALFASMTNIVSGFLITDRMLKMFKGGGQR